jgi:N-acetylglucosaminyldiphosphoundecaprenol N-acetyl-beta-D-mannosaminyltransferase
MYRKVRLLNVEVDDIAMDELVERFRDGVVLTLHVDSIMKLQSDREFYELLPKFNVITCDSQILTLAARLLGTPLKERVSGSDYFPLFYSRYKDDPSVTVFICGGAPGVAEMARQRINARVGREMVVGSCAPSLDFDRRPEEVEQLIAQINESGASVLVVGLGGGRQEKFIFRYRERLPHVRLFLPLGGTIDYEAETLRRPPTWITNAGLEWLYRVLRQPRQRWRRYFVHQPPFLYLLARQILGAYRDPFANASRGN